MNHAKPYAPEELRGPVSMDPARVRATAMALRLAEERLAHPAAAMGAEAVLRALQDQREACAAIARQYPASAPLGDQLAKAVKTTPLVGVRR